MIRAFRRFDLAPFVRSWIGSKWLFTGITIGRVMIGVAVVPKGMTIRVQQESSR